MDKINIKEKLSLFSEQWNPKIIAELNGQQVKLARLKGEFTWHKHDNEDELFFVVKGKLTIQFREKNVVINEGELIVVPRGVEHNPVAEEEVEVMLFEPATTINTGDVQSNLRLENLDWV